MSNALCDGQWHTIKAVKAKNVVRLNVDEVFTAPGIGQAGVSSTDTNDPLYVGGIPGMYPVWYPTCKSVMFYVVY